MGMLGCGRGKRGGEEERGRSGKLQVIGKDVHEGRERGRRGEGK